MIEGLSGGSEGIMTGRYAQYWNTGKGSTWEGGMHEAAFAYWKGTIPPFSRSAEVVSSLDLFPTASALANVALPSDRVYDGRDMSDVLLKPQGKSKHEVLFFYGGASPDGGGASAARMGPWKVRSLCQLDHSHSSARLRGCCCCCCCCCCCHWQPRVPLLLSATRRARVAGILGNRPRPWRLQVADLPEDQVPPRGPAPLQCPN